LRKSMALRRNLMAIGRNHTFGLEEVDGRLHGDR
jgi:hypothetical protein